MNQFMIGQHGFFDEEKFKRDFKPGFYGIQACLLEGEEEIEKLKKAAKEHSFHIGIHFPLKAGKKSIRDPQFFSLSPQIRKEAYEWMEEEFYYAKDLNPSYILLHYPKPVILDDKVDWTHWRFGDRTEYMYETQCEYTTLKEESRQLFQWLSQKGEEYHFIPVLELDALNRYIYDTTLLEELLQEFPKVRLCLDTGRLHLQDMLDPNFHALEIIQRFAKYTEVVHLWNVCIGEQIENNHYPALPQLKPEKGWGDIEAYFNIIREENKQVKVMFEHRSDLISKEELEVCYEWIASLIE